MLKFKPYTFFKKNRDLINPAFNDEWANYLFPHGGFFIEAGACGGINGSSCYELEKIGWNGICIEPNDNFFKKLQSNRKVSCENCCLTDKDGEIVFLEYEGLSCTLEAFFICKHFNKLMKYGIPTIKKSMKLETLLDKYNAPKTIHFLAMDIEKSEFDVLKNFPFHKYKILAISLEGVGCEELLLSKGYIQVKNPWSCIDYEYYFILKEAYPDLTKGQLNL